VTGVRTDIPPPLAYPIKQSGFKFVSALVSMFYGDGLAAKISAIFRLIAAALEGKGDPKKSA
jgi:hypothetical protein